MVIDLAAPSIPIDRRVLGTNVPAWLGPDLLTDQEFIDETLASGTTLLRLPGGSWSNSYRWAACEFDDDSRCDWTWAASPSDFLDFLRATGLPAVWTLSINESAQSAAAAVAFFNGAVDDRTVIGVDRDGVDWGTVAQWAQLRTDHGNPAPAGIVLWEIGNEVYGGDPESGGDGCADWGWEDVWTCDGQEYVDGTSGHDGYLTIRHAMLEVDPTISVGAVGVGYPDDWGDWGNEVIDATGDSLDFYVVHEYGFDESPTGQEALDRPGEMWPDIFDALTPVLGDAPIAITEYNLVSFEAADTEQTMTEAMNALYLAETIGQFVSHGVPIANQWNLANGTTSSGTDYGLIGVDDLNRLPSFEALRLWSLTGTELLGATVANDLGDVLFYPTRHADGRLSLLTINVGAARQFNVRLEGIDGPVEATMTGVVTDDLEADSMVEFDEPISQAADGRLIVELPRWSIAVIEVHTDE